MLFEAKLLPKAGYIEVEDENGGRGYQPTTEQLIKEEESVRYELALAELAEAQAADQTANELALAELAGMIGG